MKMLKREKRVSGHGNLAVSRKNVDKPEKFADEQEKLSGSRKIRPNEGKKQKNAKKYNFFLRVPK